MAETTTSAPENGLYYSQSASINDLTIISHTGQEIPVQKLAMEISYYEDLYSFSTSGSVVLYDGQGLLQKFQLLGYEYLRINFGRVKSSPANISRTFRIYTSSRKQVGNHKAEEIILHFCSEELMLSESIKLQKGAIEGGEEIHKTVTRILQTDLKIKKKLNIEPTRGIYNFNLNTLKPFEAISWLSTYARPETQSLAGADMLFFENKEGFNFKSLRTLMASTPYNTYKVQQINHEMPIEEKVRIVIDYEFVKSFDVLNDISAGTFANRLISVDPLTRSFKITDFDYDTYQGKLKNTPMNGTGKGISVNDKNRLGKTAVQNVQSVVKVVVGNSEQYKVPYIKDAPGSVANDIFVENYIPNRTAQISLSNFTLLKVVVPGDPGITVGKTVIFNIYTLSTSGNTRELDPYYSGKYLINAVRHVLQSQGAYQTVMELAKESYETPIGSTNSSASTAAKNE
jgi:hypothetical protein